MELVGKQPRETKTRWSAKINRAGKWVFYSIVSKEIMTCADNE